MATINFESIKADIFKSKSHYVDAREYQSHWDKKWVAYCDLIGFKEICLRSKETTANVIVRFHRIINEAYKQTPNCQLFQFTDAAFCIGSNISDVFQFALQVSNYSLAYNAIILESKKHALFQHLIIPRITIALGDVLQVNQKNISSVSEGINPDQFLAGSAIVNAYQIEGKTFAGAIALSCKDASKFVDEMNIKGKIVVRGTPECKLSKSATTRWFKDVFDNAQSNETGVIELPWPYLALCSSDGEFWAESKSSFFSKISTIVDISNKMTSYFVSMNSNIAIGKHQVGLQRFIFKIISGMKGQKTFDINRFRNPSLFLKDSGLLIKK